MERGIVLDIGRLRVGVTVNGQHTLQRNGDAALGREGEHLLRQRLDRAVAVNGNRHGRSGEQQHRNHHKRGELQSGTESVRF